MPVNLVSERDFQASIVDLARLCGWRVVHFHDSRREVGGEMVGDSDAKGWPDLTLIRDRILYREVKTEKGRVTKSQDRMLVSLLAAQATQPLEAIARIQDVLGDIENMSAGEIRTQLEWAIEALDTTGEPPLAKVWRPSDWDEIQEVLAR